MIWFARKQLDVALDRATWLETARGLEQLCDITLVSGYREHALDLETNGSLVQVHTSRVPGINIASWVLRVRPLLKSALTSGSYDVVVVDPDTLRGTPVSWLKPGRAASLVVDVRTLPVPGKGLRRALTGSVFAAAMKRARRVADGVMVISKPMADHLAGRYGWDPSSMGVWSSGVDTELFSCGARVPRRDAECLKLVYHGSLARTRGLGSLLEAVDACVRDGQDVRLTLVGSGPDAENLRSQAAGLAASGRIDFRPPMNQAELAGYLCEHDVGVIPLPDDECWNTSSPLKLFEYLSCGLPVVLTEIPAHTAVVGGADFAVWAGGGSVDKLAAAISQCARRLPELSVAAAEHGRAVALEHTWAQQAQAFYDYVSDAHG